MIEFVFNYYWGEWGEVTEGVSIFQTNFPKTLI